MRRLERVNATKASFPFQLLQKYLACNSDTMQQATERTKDVIIINDYSKNDFQESEKCEKRQIAKNVENSLLVWNECHILKRFRNSLRKQPLKYSKCVR
ncbi:hypothetical protein T01_13258 [Trichinella spiralis]|uniref:Uncharacterized protein n=1 Tax=Trichinella spiralis TaxID=6334 RepID=A0A0V1BCW2_TRISP|nr:hypothetical protein T01_13258 [Trichinella spiralis]